MGLDLAISGSDCHFYVQYMPDVGMSNKAIYMFISHFRHAA